MCYSLRNKFTGEVYDDYIATASSIPYMILRFLSASDDSLDIYPNSEGRFSPEDNLSLLVALEDLNIEIFKLKNKDIKGKLSKTLDDYLFDSLNVHLFSDYRAFPAYVYAA